MYPEIAIKETIANSLVHQDFNITGAGPMVEIYSDRIEITNPGKPLVKTDRFIDNPPKSRNEQLASFLRRIGVCEERGSGFDKIVYSTELYQLPASKIEVYDESTKVTLFAHKAYEDMSKEDKIRACYMLFFCHLDHKKRLIKVSFYFLLNSFKYSLSSLLTL